MDIYAYVVGGKVCGLFGSAQPEGTPNYEVLSETDPLYIAYMAPSELDYVMAVQELLDETARQRRYDNIGSAISYAGDPDPVFDAEGSACKIWRSAVWRKCYDDLAKVQAGQMPQPTIEAFVASLPKLDWPEVA